MSLSDQERSLGGMNAAQVTSNSSWQRDNFNSVIQKIFTDCYELLQSKNADYTKINAGDPFYNFKQEGVQHFLENNKIDVIDATSLGILIRLNDKARRISNLLLTGNVAILTESIEDTLLDQINYSAILLCWLKTQRVNESKMQGKKEGPTTYSQEQMLSVYEENARLSLQCKAMHDRISELHEEIQNEKDLNKKSPKKAKPSK